MLWFSYYYDGALWTLSFHCFVILSLLVDGILLTIEREIIIKKDIVTLLEELRNGCLKPSEVLEAYQAKSLVVDRDINAVCDYITEARQWARQLESIPVEDRGGLYGLPISVKVWYVLIFGRTLWMTLHLLHMLWLLLSGVFLRVWVWQHHWPGPAYRQPPVDWFKLCGWGEGAARPPLLSDQRAPDHAVLELQQPRVWQHSQPPWQDQVTSSCIHNCIIKSLKDMAPPPSPLYNVSLTKVHSLTF